MRIAAIVLTKNEERHIVRCLESLAGFADEVFVIDSGSTDRTVELARALGAQVLANPWRNYATQFNWGLDNAPITADWVMRIDADEFLAPASKEELLRQAGAAPAEVTGLVIRRQIHFLGRWIRHGAIYPIYHLRLWRRAYGRCEERWMDEHIELSQGTTRTVGADIIDANLNSVTWWTEKHNSYASREAVDILRQRYEHSGNREAERKLSVQQASFKRFMKESVYNRLPLGARAGAYFAYRYFVRLGFLDGMQGAIFHTLQGFWYRYLVDVKVWEVEREMRESGVPLEAAVKRCLGISLAA